MVASAANGASRAYAPVGGMAAHLRQSPIGAAQALAVAIAAAAIAAVAATVAEADFSDVKLGLDFRWQPRA